MTICTRETQGTGVTCKGSPLTNAEVDNNFINIVADIADKQDASTALTTSTSFSGDITGAYNSTALAANTVGISELNTLNTASDGKVLKYVSSPTAGICWATASSGLSEDSVGITELDIAGTGASGSFVSYNAFSGGDFCWAVPPNQYINSATVSNNCISFGYNSYGPPNIVVDFDCAAFALRCDTVPRCTAANTMTGYNTFCTYLCVTGTLASSVCQCLCGNGCFRVKHPIGCQNTAFGCCAFHTVGTIASCNVAMGFCAMKISCCACCNVVIGSKASSNAIRLRRSVAIGHCTMNCGNYVTDNVAIGNLAMRCSINNRNVAVGAYAGECFCQAQDNVAIGYFAMQKGNNIVGAVGIGRNAMAGNSGVVVCNHQSVAIGAYAHRFVTCASGEVMIGRCAGLYHFCGNSNVGIGPSAFRSMISCTGGNQRRNIAMGLFAASCSLNSQDNIVIGTCAGMRIGNTVTTCGCNNVLIGNGAGTCECIGGYLGLDNITGNCSHHIILGNCQSTCARIKVAWTVVSDCRDKSCFACVPHGLDFVRALNPTEYRLKTNGRVGTEVEDKKRYGFLAQDVLALEGDDPVVVSADNTSTLTMTESHLIPILVNAIKELANRVETLENA